MQCSLITYSKSYAQTFYWLGPADTVQNESILSQAERVTGFAESCRQSAPFRDSGPVKRAQRLAPARQAHARRWSVTGTPAACPVPALTEHAAPLRRTASRLG